jgi:hypothetical protein
MIVEAPLSEKGIHGADSRFCLLSLIYFICYRWPSSSYFIWYRWVNQTRFFSATFFALSILAFFENEVKIAGAQIKWNINLSTMWSIYLSLLSFLCGFFYSKKFTYYLSDNEYCTRKRQFFVGYCMFTAIHKFGKIF